MSSGFSPGGEPIPAEVTKWSADNGQAPVSPVRCPCAPLSGCIVVGGELVVDPNFREETRIAGTRSISFAPSADFTVLMRLFSALLMLVLTGCHLWSGGGNCQPIVENPAQTVCTQGAECECETCEESGCHSWMCGHGLFCFGHHPRYRRIPDNIMTRTRARHLAKTNLQKIDGNQCVTCDYRLGYEQAFVDVALGSCGAVPALPPPNYWKVCARSPRGHQKAQQWFSGYAAGSVRAKSIYEPYNKVAHSQFECENWYGYQSDCNIQPEVAPALQFGQ